MLPALFAIFFESPAAAALVAGGAVSIPIIIHLLNRRRFRVVTWAAMRFLLAAQRKNARRMRLEQLILLAVRCLVVLLLVLAMASVSGWAESVWRWANPEGAKGLVAGGTRTHRILVLDGSFSMGLRAGETTCFERARALAERIVEEGAGRDGFSVVLMGAPPRRLVPEPSEDARKVAAELKGARMTHGTSDLAATLSTVAGLLKSSPGKFPNKEVYFLTDLQQSAWISPRPGDLSSALQVFAEKKARTVFVDVGQDGAGNLAITNLELTDPLATTAGETILRATLHNFGDTRDEVSVRLYVGKARAEARDRPCELRPVAESLVRAERNQQVPVAFRYKFPSPGEYVLQVQAAHDGLEVDDTRSVVVTVKDTVPVLLVNGKPAPEFYDRATGWLHTALNPWEEGEAVPANVPARVKAVSASQFHDAGESDLAAYDCVFLCDVPRFSPGEVRRLEDHVRRGGSVVFCLGNNVDLAAYNESLYREGRGLLPARLLGKQTAKSGYAFQLALDPNADRSDPLTPFRDSGAREELLAARFTTFVQAEPVGRGGPRTVLRFAPVAVPGSEAVASRSAPPPGGPAILEWHPPASAAERGLPGAERLPPRMRGRVVLITTAVNADWGNWPATRAFPPLMNEVLYFSASARLRERSAGVGDPLEVFLPAGSGASDAVVSTPEGREETIHSQRVDESGVLRWTDTDLSGVYKLVVGQHPREHLFAVNPPATSEVEQLNESNLARTSAEELQKTYPEWELQVVTDLGQVSRTSASSSGPEEVPVPQGPAVARVLLLILLALVLAEVVLAWQFGHYSATSSADEQAPPRKPGARDWALRLAPWLLLGCFLAVAFVLVHDAWTGDFLGFLPEAWRGGVERAMGIPPPAPGEGSHWRLEYTPYFRDARTTLWVAGVLAVLGAAGVALIYRQEGRTARGGARALLVALRVALLMLMLAVFLPQLQVYFERQGWPDVVILIDDSQSMSAYDSYGDPVLKSAADSLAEKAKLTEEEQERLEAALASRPELTRAERLRLAKTLLARGKDDWLTALVSKRKVRLHVYRCSARAQRLADVTTPQEVRPALEAIEDLRAESAHDSSQLGTAVRQVLNDFRGSSLAAVVMLTDGVTTEGEDLARVSKYASQMGVPLFFVGLGDSHEVRDVYLHDLQVEDSVYVNDRLVFELRLTAQGYPGLSLPVRLYEKGKDQPLDTKTVSVGGDRKTVKVRLTHRPAEPGEKVYVIRVPVQQGEVDRDNNVLERSVFVRDAKQIKVLYVEGYRRYEYQYLKTLLERESNRVKGNKSIDLKVLNLDADPEFASEDRSAISSFPTREELKAFDVIILGDVDPEPRDDNRMTEHLKEVADFVRERGGGLLMLAGERFSPRAYRNSPLKDVLPIDVTDTRPDDEDAVLTESYRPELTPVGRMHPIFRFSPDEKENEAIWNRLSGMYWYASGYEPKRAAEVLAVHPRLRAGGRKASPDAPDKHPLVLQQFVGAGRCMFFGLDETWRWNWREDQLHYNQFWIQTVRYLARSRLGRIELRLDRQTPYRRGEPIKMTVRFPDDAPPPAADTEVKVVVERRSPGRPADTEVRTVGLARVEGSRATFESTLTQTPDGEYKFWLSSPSARPRPRAECKVLAPPGEMERLRMNQAEMEQAASESQGRFYTLADADRLLDELPAGNRVTVNAPGPPAVVWNYPLLFLLAVGFLTTEWLLRKKKNLL